jgi:hypothetical protein
MILAATRRSLAAAALALAVLCAGPITAQTIEEVDPNDFAIDGDLSGETWTPSAPPAQALPPVPEAYEAPAYSEQAPAAAPAWAQQAAATPTAQGDTYKEDDLIGAAEGVFGKGAEGLARMIEDLLKKQGEPNGYIVGREAGGAFIFGLRYGSGTLFHKVEGQRPVYWTGPSLGVDLGANAANTFVLVYNLHDTEELYERYPAGGGDAYFIGGLTASYLRKGDTVLIPIRMGAGLRLGFNAGYMKFSKRQRWQPF